MAFIADLHIHSRFSMATSRKITVPHLDYWARLKGIGVLGTGDFTHPQWRAELEENLVQDERSGFYRYRGESSLYPDRAPLYCLQTEISCIYKRGGKVRKVHNLVYMPDFEAVERLCRRLEVIGNLKSDGRPILGLDSHDLLEIVLETSPQAHLIPAHIWTPWFALFGSKSGFDRIEDCYGDLTEYIFALEMGLSSDPYMNRCLSALDGFSLISNSDAHSGPILGREANLFSGEPSYAGMFSALRKPLQPDTPKDCEFIATMEIYPEEGKYHLDGHRNCQVVLSPSESEGLNNICPVCNKPLTIGVLHRVMELADRTEPRFTENHPVPRMFIPLPEILGEILQVGSGSRKVRDKYLELVERLAPELDILWTEPIDRIKAHWDALGEAIERMRAGKVKMTPGFDGQYGIIKLFEPHELAGYGSSSLVPAPDAGPVYKRQPFVPMAVANHNQPHARMEFSKTQRQAIEFDDRPVFIAAGPGAGKTGVLIERVKNLVARGVRPEDILVITFTRRAAQELRDRLSRDFTNDAIPQAATLHSLAYELGRAQNPGLNLALLGEEAAFALFQEANPDLGSREAKKIWERIGLARERLDSCDASAQARLDAYRSYKSARCGANWLDYTDLLEWLKDNGKPAWKYVLVDEAQDLSPLQLAVIAGLVPESGQGFFGIGDPDQAIYSFRGAVENVHEALLRLWPDLQTLTLEQSYRSSQGVLDLAYAIQACHQCKKMTAFKNVSADLVIFRGANDREEARWIARTIKGMAGPTSHTLMDAAAGSLVALNDIAILVRIKAQIPTVAAALEESAIPFTAPALESFWHDEQCRIFINEAINQKPAVPPREFLSGLTVEKINQALLLKSPAFIKLEKMWHKLSTWEAFFDELAWMHEAEAINAKAESVRILTMHAAKGLEFDKVFVPGLEDGLLPLNRALLFGEEGDTTQEANLLYVALTRAATGVYISYCDERVLFGNKLRLAPSPWLGSLRKLCDLKSRKIRKEKVMSHLSLFGEAE